MGPILTLRTKIVISLVIAWLSLLVIGLLSYRSIGKLKEDAGWVTHTHTVIEQLQQMDGLLKDAQRGERGFLLTGQDRFLETYHSAHDTLPTVLARIRQTTADNDTQQRNIAVLSPLLNELLADYERAIALRKNEGLEAAVRLVETGEIKAQMDRLSRLIDVMIAEEERLLATRTATTSASVGRTEGVILLGGILALLYLLVAGIAIHRDMTKRLETQRALAASEERFRTLFDTARSAIVQLDPNGHIVEFNPEAERLHEVKRSEVIGQEYGARFLTDAYRNPFQEAIAKALHGHSLLDLETNLRTNDSDRVVSWNLTSITKGRLRIGVLAAGQDITERKQLERKLLHASLHDGLTGLPNRTFLLKRLSEHLSQRTPSSFALLYLDLDRFKLVNDNLGHSAGDALLVATARRLTDHLTPEHTVARLGGDEFAILADGIASEEEALSLAERVRNLLNEPLQIANHAITPVGSVGVALVSGEETKPEDVLRDADTAMYRAKSGGNAAPVLFRPYMLQELHTDFDLIADLRQAIEREEFELHYQPIVSLSDGHVVGFEALVRWMHPVRGLVPPMAFIPFAEENGLIGPIGAWVLRAAARQMATWQRDIANDLLLFLSVNFSRRQLQEPSVVELVERTLRETGLSPRRLMLEITETLLVDDEHFATAELPRIKELGVQLCVDDFGTGYSSLSFLQGKKVGTLKIDRSFTARLGDPAGIEIVRAIVDLAHNLHMHVIPEGIETPEHLAILQGLGCEYGQGFLFSRPVPVDQAEQMLLQQPDWLHFWENKNQTV